MRGEQTDHSSSLITEERENERKEQKRCEWRALECLHAKGEDVGDEKGLYMYVHSYTNTYPMENSWLTLLWTVLWDCLKVSCVSLCSGGPGSDWRTGRLWHWEQQHLPGVHPSIATGHCHMAHSERWLLRRGERYTIGLEDIYNDAEMYSDLDT